MKLNDTVVLKLNLPDQNLYNGDIGAIVEVYSEDAFEVEFVTGDGHTQALITLAKKDLRLVSGMDILSVRELDAVA